MAATRSLEFGTDAAQRGGVAPFDICRFRELVTASANKRATEVLKLGQLQLRRRFPAVVGSYPKSLTDLDP